MRILIVGAGIAGLAMQRTLSLRGFKATIVERNPLAGLGGAGLFLPGNSVRAINQLGLLEGLLENSSPINLQRFCDENGRELNVIDTNLFWRHVGLCRSITRSALWQLLESSIPPNAIQYRHVVGVQNNKDYCNVRFDDGAFEQYDLVIGADGVNSTIRALTFPSAPTPEYVGNVCWRSIVPNLCGIKEWTVMLGTNRSLLGKPLPMSKLYIYADMSLDKSQVERYSSATDLETLFGDIAGPLKPSLGLSSKQNTHFAELVSLRMNRWYRNRVVLIGDAAHASPPSMAQGAGMAMEDALVLAEELVGSQDINSAIRHYEERRRKRVDWVDTQCVSRDTMRRLPRVVRNSLLRIGGAWLYDRAYNLLKEPI